jgi:hypothetical protein
MRVPGALSTAGVDPIVVSRKVTGNKGYFDTPVIVRNIKKLPPRLP